MSADSSLQFELADQRLQSSPRSADAASSVPSVRRIGGTPALVPFVHVRQSLELHVKRANGRPSSARPAPIVSIVSLRTIRPSGSHPPKRRSPSRNQSCLSNAGCASATAAAMCSSARSLDRSPRCSRHSRTAIASSRSRDANRVTRPAPEARAAPHHANRPPLDAAHRDSGSVRSGLSIDRSPSDASSDRVT